MLPFPWFRSNHIATQSGGIRAGAQPAKRNSIARLAAYGGKVRYFLVRWRPSWLSGGALLLCIAVFFFSPRDIS